MQAIFVSFDVIVIIATAFFIIIIMQLFIRTFLLSKAITRHFE